MLRSRKLSRVIMSSDSVSRSLRDSSMNIRIDRRARNLIDRAASCLGKNRSDFVLEIACREAENVLLDRAYIAVGEETFTNFCQMLDNPPSPSEGLLKLMKKKAPWA
jgi:uncharacterized protein (DUF1778 family)